MRRRGLLPNLPFRRDHLEYLCYDRSRGNDLVFLLQEEDAKKPWIVRPLAKLDDVAYAHGSRCCAYRVQFEVRS